MSELTTTALANWFGTDRMLCDRIARELRGCNWVGVPFAGGMGVLARLDCQQGVASDLHRHVINLARVVRDPRKRAELIDRLEGLPHHEELLAEAQVRLIEREQHHARAVNDAASLFMPSGEALVMAQAACQPPEGIVEWAADYYIASFMTRAGSAGTPAELKSGLSVRWKAGGGGSSQRWRSAVGSITPWGDLLHRWTFVVMDAFAFLDQAIAVDARAVAEDQALRNGLYCDPPFPFDAEKKRKAGEAYRFRFTIEDHRRLARELRRLERTRVVLRYHDHELVRELYANDPHWTITRPAGRLQTNEAADELLILNGPSLIGGGR